MFVLLFLLFLIDDKKKYLGILICLMKYVFGFIIAPYISVLLIAIVPDTALGYV